MITGKPCLSVLTKTEVDFSTSTFAKRRTNILNTSLRYLKVKVKPLFVTNEDMRANKILKGLSNSLTE
jgi:hypothetical protein